NFRAIEDRLPDIVNFLLSKEARPSELHEAMGLKAREDLIGQLEKQYGTVAVARGKAIFVENCARCHSSQEGPVPNRDFYATDQKTGLRLDWMSNDKSTPASKVGSNYSRALHSNHMKGHVWEQFGSETLRARPSDPSIKEPADGGRGYFRNPSLLSIWAYAPLLHNNAVGPEICGEPLADYFGNPLANTNSPGCWRFDPSAQGRFKLFEASMQSLLNPKERGRKITRLDRDIVLELGPRLWDGKEKKKIVGLKLTVPKGTPAALLGNFQHKPFFVDLVAAKAKPEELKARLVARLGTEKGNQIASEMRSIADEIIDEPEKLLTAVKKRLPLLLEVYSSSTDLFEDSGHHFGENLSPEDKRALIAFLATL
ncbi:MAG TPA: cytochrome c, partial [Candidatus Binatia bacterium]|nr:cytochrome c [Candidatus Binatia bacterium]